MFWSLTNSTGGVNSKETLLSSQKKKSYSRLLCKLPTRTSGGSRGGAREARLPPYFSTKMRLEWPQKIFLETGPPPDLRGWMTAPPPPPHLKVGAATAYSKFHCAVQINKARIITIRQGSASASKNYYNGCFWKSAIASVFHAKKQMQMQKSGLHEALAKMLLKWSYCICCYGHLLPIRQWIKGRGRSRYHAAWDSFSNFFLFWFISSFGIPLWYFTLWLLENFLRITTFL